MRLATGKRSPPRIGVHLACANAVAGVVAPAASARAATKAPRRRVRRAHNLAAGEGRFPTPSCAQPETRKRFPTVVGDLDIAVLPESGWRRVPDGHHRQTPPAVQAPWPGRIGESCKKSESF